MTGTEVATPAGRPPVMTDVARRAGVSHQTVSRVLNGHPSIRPETRERVQRAIDELGYRRNRAARALVTRRTLTVGVVASSTSLFGPSSTLHGVERAAHAAGYATILSTSDATDRDGVLARVAQLSDRGVDGLLLTAPLHEVPDLREHLPADLPTVCATGGPVTGLPSVHVDHRAGARAVTELLLRQGHREVRHVGGSPGWFEAAEREGGWRDALAAAGVAPAPVLAGGWGAAEGYVAGLALADDPATTAVVAANDQLALGLLRALRERGVDVPRRVSVTGFDDAPESAYLSPPLTTVRQDLERVGREAVGLLLERLAGGVATAPEHRVVVPELVVRASTGPPPR
ncbi:LacI family DNA-binding transcriptional regulator [uncultured Pseudokineococcus sp.]|uniref:LacI family DNA-binding transcriptional regulator n=1 Tax=uncultured Pseudokineococcus sp. TaxID=1642928 RepID=UPI002636E277|nr:LacI family DNA-binding transcriptional regulator [uncultured Pseudokineococcus sp.]